jgi:hypothetical protein
MRKAKKLLLLIGGLGAGQLAPPPAGYSYVYVTDNNGANNIVTVTDASGAIRPIYRYTG